MISGTSLDDRDVRQRRSAPTTLLSISDPTLSTGPTPCRGLSTTSLSLLFRRPRSVMDGNKDEARRCIKIVGESLAAGDKQRALRFIGIAQRLDPNLDARDLISACERLQGAAEIAEEPSPPTSSEPSTETPAEKSYGAEHVKLIKEIRRHGDYYAVLGVEKSCSAEEIRRAYRKLSLRVHPDKNKAPGAEEAFKTVCKAFKCLSDDESRRRYDQNGFIEDSELLQQQNHFRRRRRRATTASRDDFFDDAFDPDEIFNSFFFGGTQGDVFRAQARRAYRPRGAGRQPGEQNVHGGFNTLTFLQIVPILLFLLIAYLPFSEPQYSLQKTYTYTIPRVTEKHGVEYFVKSSEFEQRFPEGSAARDELESNVLRDYKGVLGRYCHMELQRRQWARNYPTPHCDRLRSLSVA